MEVRELLVERIAISEANTRKDLTDGQSDSDIEDLARSIERQGLLQPISVRPAGDGRFEVVAGQRRLMAFRLLKRETISAVIHTDLSPNDAVAISLVENVHRADMNPRDKAAAFGALLGQLGTVGAVAKSTGVGEATIRKYLLLRSLAPELQQRLAAGEVRNTDALATLARRFQDDPAIQLEVWDRIGGFRQDIQQEVLRKLDPEMTNLEELVSQAAEGELGFHLVRNCPRDCPTLPAALKPQVAQLIRDAQR
jgi:ParB family transcriptional regulator, chromosome partitioning protein